MLHYHKGYAELVLYSILAGLVGVFVRLVENLDVYSIVFFRATIAYVFIFIILAFRNKLSELVLESPLRTFLVGLFQGLSIFLYFTAVLKTSVSNAVFLLYTAPLFSVIIAKLFLGEKIERETIIGIVITLLGIVLILDPRTFSFASDQTVGNLLGLLSGLTYAAMALTAKPILQKASGYNLVFWQYLIISVMFSFFLQYNFEVAMVVNWWKLLAIGILCTGIPFVLFMNGIKKVKAQKIFIITALEPLAGTFFAILLLREIPSVLTLVGALFIVYGVYRVASKDISPLPSS